jgi:NAD(P)-dependent dehydrogenase (short-subunit alcohol dehydrogenase family)
MAREPRSLVGKVVAITGGARGIGEATARALVAKGAKVAIGDLDRELAERTAADIGSDTLALELDVTRRDSFEGFLDQVEERLGSLDVLVNNAGIMPLGRFTDEDDLTAERMIDINVHGVLYGMKLALPRM